MELVPVKLTSVIVTEPLRFALWDEKGVLLAKKGYQFDDRRELEELVEGRDNVYIDIVDSAVHRQQHLGQMVGMLNSNVPLGRIADSQPTAKLPDGPSFKSVLERSAPEVEKDPDWPYLQEQLHAILRRTEDSVFINQLDRVDQKLSLFSRLNADGVLLALIQMAAVEVERYSATHAMLVSVMCGIAAREVLKWPLAEQECLSRAALTMNIGMTELQDRLAQQKEPLGPPQRRIIDGHARRSAEMLQKLGVSDGNWITAVLEHHSRTPGPLGSRTPGERMARLIQRADMFAAAISPRAGRKPMLPGLAMKAAYFDELKQVDEAGAALIKAVGIYSPGTFVRLACGELAVVVRRGANTTTPTVAVIVSKSGLANSELTLRDTTQPEFKITASVPHHDIRSRPNLKRLLPLTLGRGKSLAT